MLAMVDNDNDGSAFGIEMYLNCIYDRLCAMTERANVHTDEQAIVSRFNICARAVPRNMFMELCDRQRSGEDIFGPGVPARYPDWANVISTITTWKLYNDREDYTYDLLATAQMGDEARQREYALSFIQWWEQRYLVTKPFYRPPQRPLRMHKHANPYLQ